MFYEEVKINVNYRPFINETKADMREVMFIVSELPDSYKAVPVLSEEERELIKIPTQILFYRSEGKWKSDPPTEQWTVDVLIDELKKLHNTRF